MNVDLDIHAIEMALSARHMAPEIMNFDSSFVVGNAVFLFLDDQLVGVEPYKFLLSMGAEA